MEPRQKGGDERGTANRDTARGRRPEGDGQRVMPRGRRQEGDGGEGWADVTGRGWANAAGRVRLGGHPNSHAGATGWT